MTTRIERHRQLLEVMELRRRGGTLASIAAATGLSASTVQRRIAAALEALGSESADQLRRQADDRYADLLRRAYALLDPGVLDEVHHPRVLALIRAITADSVRLWGVSVPPVVVLRGEGIEC